MRIILIILSFIGVYLNFDAPEKISTIGNVTLVFEHILVLVAAFYIIKKHFTDNKIIDRYYNCFLLGYLLCLLMVAFWWRDELFLKFTINWDAFDPIKYYSMASLVLDGNTPPNIQHFPVVYIYAVVMYVLGVNPLVPLFFNILLYVYAVCLITKYINNSSSNVIGYYCLLFLIPECLYYMIMSAKDTICLLMATIIFVKSSIVFEGNYKRKDFLILIVAFILMAVSRLSLSFASILGIILLNMNLKRLTFQKVLFVIFAIGAFAIALYVGGSLGTETYAERTIDVASQELLTGDVSRAVELRGQSEDSFARKLIPHNSVEFIVFGVIRSICYIIIDPRFINDPISLFSFSGVMRFSPLVNFTTLLMFIFNFVILWWFVKIKKSQRVRNTLYITIMYVLLVGMFNPKMIHIRYRLVYDLLYFSIAIQAFYSIKLKNKPPKKHGRSYRKRDMSWSSN